MVDGFQVLSRPRWRDGQWPEPYKVVDVVLHNLEKSDVRDAHISGLDTINVFLDRLAVITYGPCRLVKMVSTCPARVDVGAEFDMVTHDLGKRVHSPDVEPTHLAPFEALARDSPVHEAAHHIRLALSEDAAEQHLLHLHIAAERIAMRETDERVKNRCPSCAHEWDGPPASRRAVRALLGKRGVTKADADGAVAVRGQIAHGGGKRNFAFYERTTELAGAIEGAAMSIVAERGGVVVHRRMGVVVGPPMTIHRAKKWPDGTFELLATDWRAPIRFPALGDDVSRPEGSVEAGFPTSPNGQPAIDPCAWPD
jgi:hypothetical protein